MHFNFLYEVEGGILEIEMYVNIIQKKKNLL